MSRATKNAGIASALDGCWSGGRGATVFAWVAFSHCAAAVRFVAGLYVPCGHRYSVLVRVPWLQVLVVRSGCARPMLAVETGLAVSSGREVPAYRMVSPSWRQRCKCNRTDTVHRGLRDLAGSSSNLQCRTCTQQGTSAPRFVRRPLRHIVGCCESASQYDPTGHRVGSVTPTGQYEPAGHPVQSETCVFSAFAPIFEAGHGVVGSLTSGGGDYVGYASCMCSHECVTSVQSWLLRVCSC